MSRYRTVTCVYGGYTWKGEVYLAAWPREDDYTTVEEVRCETEDDYGRIVEMAPEDLGFDAKDVLEIQGRLRDAARESAQAGRE